MSTILSTLPYGATQFIGSQVPPIEGQCAKGFTNGAAAYDAHLVNPMDSFRARDISLKAQKKLLSKMSNKTLAKSFIDDTLASVLDNLYSLFRGYTGNKKEAEKVVKNIIKIVVKINILYRNDQFVTEDLKVANQLRNKFNTIVKTVISFFEVAFSFDKSFLTKAIEDCRGLLKQLVGNHLTDKSIGRIDHVFDAFTEPAFMEELFRPESPHRPTLQAIVDDMSKAFDEGGI
ncbi:Tumor necrosis factor alpha-induced protein 8-like protein 1 [Chionoecetes opilio]|uniref:Tumor necrosis factor alpha-induced protein 8-like protein 1 n=1 Tax=Chionoecetes opilio TaxID=41210 RepID=A0A8J5CZB5_CHIOP|nr:Tumor necrosis factor alpha-induced protein 8-like protein 1 [Chionoecetes opilio]